MFPDGRGLEQEVGLWLGLRGVFGGLGSPPAAAGNAGFTQTAKKKKNKPVPDAGRKCERSFLVVKDQNRM